MQTQWFKFSVFAALLYSFNAYGISSGNSFISDEATPIASLIVNIGFCIGIILFGTGIWGLHKSHSMPAQFPVAQAYSKCGSGVALLAASELYTVVVNTFFSGAGFNDSLDIADSSLFSDDISDISNSAIASYLPENTLYIILGFLYLAGLYSFIKGLFLLKNLTSAAQMGAGWFPKSVVHIGSGVVLMNIIRFGCIMAATLGYSGLC